VKRKQTPLTRRPLNQGGQHGARDGARKLEAQRQRKERKLKGEGRKPQQQQAKIP
jgi:hypothetical protein